MNDFWNIVAAIISGLVGLGTFAFVVHFAVNHTPATFAVKQKRNPMFWKHQPAHDFQEHDIVVVNAQKHKNRGHGTPLRSDIQGKVIKTGGGGLQVLVLPLGGMKAYWFHIDDVVFKERPPKEEKAIAT